MKHPMCDAYYSQGIKGKMARVLFKPTLPANSPCHSPMSPTIREELEQPRLCLRFLASYRVLTYLGLLFVFLRLIWGLSPLSFFVFLCLGYLLFIFIRALLFPTPLENTWMGSYCGIFMLGCTFSNEIGNT